MEEDFNFKTNGISTQENPKELEIIYDEVKTEESAWNTNPVKPEKEKKAPLCSLLHLVPAGLGIICVILASTTITLSIHFHGRMSEQLRETINLTAQNLQLRKEKTGLERQMAELSRQRGRLNWTISVILTYENFPVDAHCPQRVCKPCLDGWALFQSNCYLFYKSVYYYHWMTWQSSRNYCRHMNADLVVIDSQEEQELINNHTEDYSDERHGYWIGLSDKNRVNSWMWVDGSNSTKTYWTTRQLGYRGFCALTLPHADPLANWQKTSCEMRNLWICETRALIKPDEDPAAFSKKVLNN